MTCKIRKDHLFVSDGFIIFTIKNDSTNYKYLRTLKKQYKLYQDIKNKNKKTKY